MTRAKYVVTMAIYIDEDDALEEGGLDRAAALMAIEHAVVDAVDGIPGVTGAKADAVFGEEGER